MFQKLNCSEVLVITELVLINRIQVSFHRFRLDLSNAGWPVMTASAYASQPALDILCVLASAKVRLSARTS